VSDIEKFTGHPAIEPIRAYAGLAASDAEPRAALAVRDLEREGGFGAWTQLPKASALGCSSPGKAWVRSAARLP
jgi:uncharacterized membrane protein